MIKYAASFLLGALLTCAFFSVLALPSLAFFCPAILLYRALDQSPKQAFAHGLFFGLGFFGVATSWIFVSIYTYGNAPLAISALITGLFVFILALYPATQLYFIRQFFQFKKEWITCLLVFPASWVLSEFLRSVLFTGFPWILLGYSQLTTPLRGFFPLVGVYGVSLACTAIAGALTLLARYPGTRMKTLSIVIIIGIALIGAIFSDHAWTVPAGKPLVVSLVQGNIPIQMKWNENQLIKTLNTYDGLTQAHQTSALIVWPEAAVPIFPDAITGYIESLKRITHKNKNTLIFGAPLRIGQSDYNGLVALGETNGFYLKRHLVPFGEYYPLQWAFKWFTDYFNIPMSNYVSGKKDQLTLYAGALSLAPFICYEIVFPGEVLYHTRGKNMIVTITDDSWFGQSFAMGQQFQMTQARALEMGRPVLAAANSGITGIIDPFGRVIAEAAINKTAVVTGEIRPMQGNTPLMRLGYWPLVSALLLILFIAFFL